MLLSRRTYFLLSICTVLAVWCVSSGLSSLPAIAVIVVYLFNSRPRRKVPVLCDSVPTSRSLPAQLSVLEVEGPPTATVCDDWAFLDSEHHLTAVRTGGCLYRFVCVSGSELRPLERTLISMFVNLSCFMDEATQNHSPPVNVEDGRFMCSHMVALNKACYALPGVSPREVTPELLSSYAYQSECQSESAAVWRDGEKGWTQDYNTFRVTRTVLPWLVWATFQFCVSDIRKEDLPRLSALTDGLQVHRGLLMEKTKRNGPQPDKLKKVKSVFLLHHLPGEQGVLVFHLTCATAERGFWNRVLSSLVAAVGPGVEEVVDTCERTRRYFRGVQAAVDGESVEKNS